MSHKVQPGETIAGYTLESILSEGTAGNHVYVARHPKHHNRVAIKIMTYSTLMSRSVRLRFLQEARSSASLQHPHIVKVFDFEETIHPPRIALIMELIAGPTMHKLRGFVLPRDVACKLSRQLIEATQAAHQAGIIHRDLKPANILFVEDPRTPNAKLCLKVVDFGLAKRLGPESLLQTPAGKMLGTPAYMAPEQIMGRPAPSKATDVYAVAELIYELFTGQRIFNTDSTETILQQKMRGSIELLPTSSLGRELHTLIAACLDPDPQQRPQLQALATLLSNVHSKRAPSKKPQPTRRFAPVPFKTADTNTVPTQRKVAPSTEENIPTTPIGDHTLERAKQIAARYRAERAKTKD